jgi:hypothetical protein
MPWACSQPANQPLWFVAQINLSEIKSFDLENLLPKEGMLYFFVRYDECRVLYYNGDYGVLQRAIASEQLLPFKQSLWQNLYKKKERMLFESCALHFNTEYTHPSWDS